MDATWKTVRVIVALVRREALTRFGRNRLGYLWAFLEAIGYLAIFLSIRSFVADRIPFGDNLLLFMLTGVLTYRLAMNIAKRCTGAIQANLALLTFPLVKTFDVIVARIVLESVSMLLVAAIFLAGLELFAAVRVFRTPEELMIAFAATVYLGAGLGFFNATVSRIIPAWERLWNLLSLPLFISSGIVFVPAALPPEVFGIIYYNPFLHCVEWVREAAYIDYHASVDRLYLISLSTVFLLTGLLVNYLFQNEMIVE